MVDPRHCCIDCESFDTEESLEEDTFYYGVGDGTIAFTVEVPVWTCQICASSYTDERAKKIKDKVVKDYLETTCIDKQRKKVDDAVQPLRCRSGNNHEVVKEAQKRAEKKIDDIFRKEKTVATVRVRNLVVAINETEEGVRIFVLDDDKGVDEPVGDFFVGFKEGGIDDV